MADLDRRRVLPGLDTKTNILGVEKIEGASPK
jgi:hypothetical protein